MATKKRPGLGKRRLNTLISSVNADASGEPPEGAELKDIPIEMIRPGRYQPRIDMRPETLEELADSIRSQGVVQPIVVRPLGDDQYEIIAGERRWRAAQTAGLHEIPAVIRDVPDQAAVAMALIENIQRENLNPLEESRALERLIQEFEMTHQETAEAVGRSRASVSNLLRLLELGEDARRFVEQRELEMGHARALLSLKGQGQAEAARQVVSRGLSVRETEKLVKKFLEGGDSKPAPPPRKDPDISRLEQDLTERLGARVGIQHGKKGKGKVVINYNSLDELDGILEKVQK